MQDYTLSRLSKMVKDSFGRYDAQGTRHWTWQIALAEVLYIAAERGIDMNRAMEAMVKSDTKKVRGRTSPQ